MNTPTSKTISLHEKLSSSEYMLFFLGIIFYTEAFLAFKYDGSILDFSFVWYQSNVSASDLILYFFIFSFFYAVVLQLLFYYLNLYLVNREKIVFENYISLNQMKSDALINSNSALYKHYEKLSSKLREAENIRKLALAVLILSIAVLLSYFSSSSEESMFDSFLNNISKDGGLWGLLRVILFFYSMWLINIVMIYESEGTYGEHINDYGLCHESRWLSEISSGLLKIEELLLCLSEVKRGFDMDDFKIKNDFRNQYQKYCKVHGLIKIVERNIVLTDKGKFFEKYLCEINTN